MKAFLINLIHSRVKCVAVVFDAEKLMKEKEYICKELAKLSQL